MAQTVLKILVHFFEGVEIYSGTLRKGYNCRPCVRLVAKYQLVHENVASTVRKVLLLLPMAGGGAFVQVGVSDLALSKSGSTSSSSHVECTAQGNRVCKVLRYTAGALWHDQCIIVSHSGCGR